MGDSKLDIAQQSEKEETLVKVCKQEGPPDENRSSTVVVKEEAAAERHSIPILGEREPTLSPCSKEKQAMPIPIVGQEEGDQTGKGWNSAPQKGFAFSHVRKLFIGGLSNDTTDESLAHFYKQFGSLEDCIVLKDPITGCSRRFGFVTYAYAHEVEKALSLLPHIIDGKQVDPKRALSRADMARERECQMAVGGGTPQWNGGNYRQQQSSAAGWSGTPSYQARQRFPPRGATPYRQPQSTPGFIDHTVPGSYRQRATPALNYSGEMKRTRMDTPALAPTQTYRRAGHYTPSYEEPGRSLTRGRASMHGGVGGARLPQQPLWSGGYGYGGYVSGAWAGGGDPGDGGWNTQSAFGAQGSYPGGSNPTFYDPNRGGGRGRGWR